MRKRFIANWTASGTAEVFAEDAREAQSIVTDGLLDWHGDIGWEDVEVYETAVSPPEEL